MAEKITNVTLSWSELKTQFLQAVEGKYTIPDSTTASNVRKWREGRNKDWVGCTLSEMKGWLKNGYRQPEFATSGNLIFRAKKRKLRFSDEGDLLLPEALSGYDYPFLQWDQRERKPGLRIVLDWAFSCTTKAHYIANLGAYMSSLIGTFELQGYDLEVDCMITLRQLYTTDRHNDKSNTIVRVKQLNEFSDFTEWSAIFSPGGFRMLGFYALGMGAVKLSRRTSIGLGYPPHNDWKAEFNSDERTVYIWTPNQLDNVPVEKLNNQLYEAGVL